jgi:sugar phosphate permease
MPLPNVGHDQESRPHLPSNPPPGRPTHVRKVVLGLTVAAYMITYMDRVIMAASIPSIQKDLGFSLVTMGNITFSFRLAYAFFQIPGGWLGDRFGPRRALTAIVIWWSMFTAATAAAWSAVSMGTLQVLFGMGEAGAYPVATRSLARWALPSERGFAQGITHAGARLGGALTPPLVVFLIVRYSWRMPFVCFGILGILWALVWFWYYRDDPALHPRTNDAERALLRNSLGSAGKNRKAIPWKFILSSPQMWTISGMYFCYAYILDFYLTWFPKYLNSVRGFNLTKMGLYASVPLAAGVAGDLFGGWFSDVLYRRTGNLKLSRRLVAVGGFLLAAASIWPAYTLADPVQSVLCSGLVMFGIETTVGVSWAVTLDVGGEFAGSVSAIMNSIGNGGGAIGTFLVPRFVEAFGWYAPFLVIGGLALTAAMLFLRIDASRKVVPA